jgi:hypothetical protein
MLQAGLASGSLWLLNRWGYPQETLTPKAEVKRIWDRGPHNAFTDLLRWQDRWYCVFREGADHAQGAGIIRILVSANGQDWESLATISKEQTDLRDPKLSVTPENQLLLVGGAAFPAHRQPLTDHYSFVCFSKDGKSWSAPERVLDSWEWLWRVTWHKGVAYGVAYTWDPKQRRQYRAFLAKSRNGRAWEKVSEFEPANCTEASLAFEGDKLFCLQRRDGSPNTALLGESLPPHTQWTWRDLGVYFGGPHLIRLPNGRWWACGRRIDQGKATTILAELDVQAGKLRPVLTLPSAGDTSYPGLVWYDGELWISYYSSHEGKSNVYLARVRL